jgi:hypothetical protein
MLILCHCQPDTSDAPPPPTPPHPCIKYGERLMPDALMVHVVTAGSIYQLELVDVLLLGVT